MRITLILSLVMMTMSAPQYGGGNSQPIKAPAPVQSASVQCRTEYAEVWDTQYVETETQECKTMQNRLQKNSVCQNRDKNAKPCTSQYATQSTRRFAVRSTGMRRSTTQRLSATLTTRKTVNINGRALVTTRFGHQSLELARIMHMTSVKMCRKRN